MKLLNKDSYHLALEAIQQVTINKLFALAVIEQKVEGAIYVDNTENPSAFLVCHPYGMSLLFGNEQNAEFNTAFVHYAFNGDNRRVKTEWLQSYPTAWNTKLTELFEHKIIREEAANGNVQDGKIELSTRVNFKFNIEKYQMFKKNFKFEPYEIVRTHEQLFDKIEGTVVPKYFWNNAADFVKNAVAFTLLYNDKIASTAFSAFVQNNKLELGIESLPQFRGKAFATHTCVALIDYCIENGYEPIWACRLQNVNSYKLAQKLGFEPTIYIPFYKLVTSLC